MHEGQDSVWVGWPGHSVGAPDDAWRAGIQELEKQRCVPVELSADEQRQYYEGYSNGVLWPLFHSMIDMLPLTTDDFAAYERVNERFAERVASIQAPGDIIWVHDYQLMLVPSAVRRLVPDARIGFFLHIPFPSWDVFRTVGARERLLQGLLGADVIGFHTASYMRHFALALTRLLGLQVELDRVSWDDRDVRLGVFPMGIDAEAWAHREADPSMTAELVTLKEKGVRILVGIDRLDYTKGIPRRLLAFERLLRDAPELRGKIQLVQVGVPSRTEVDSYKTFREQVELLVGRILGQFASASWVPVHYLYRSLDDAEISALYRAADVMLVTPIRDGMNLVAKEFVASRTDGDGVLVLSEFAGAAAELAEAVHINPFDIQRSAESYRSALEMPEAERRGRMRALRQRVLRHDVHRWTRSFVGSLRETATAARGRPCTAEQFAALVQRIRSAPFLVLLLDYDGTLVPLAKTPELAAPDARIVELLGSLARRPRTETHLVSGRSRDDIERWFGGTGVGLHAEHGGLSRQADGKWIARGSLDSELQAKVDVIFEDFAGRTPGSLVERKATGIAFHWRTADPEYGAQQSNELKIHLSQVLSNAPVEVIAGDKVVELRPYGVNKGVVVTDVARTAPDGALFVAFGDDRTDTDLFAALPEGSISIRIGPNPLRADFVLATPQDARRLLSGLLR